MYLRAVGVALILLVLGVLPAHADVRDPAPPITTAVTPTPPPSPSPSKTPAPLPESEDVHAELGRTVGWVALGMGSGALILAGSLALTRRRRGRYTE